MNARLYHAIGVDLTRMPNLRKLALLVPCINDTFDRPDGTDMVAGLSKLLDTTSPEHKLEIVHLHFSCVVPFGTVGRRGPQDIKSHLRGANWAALDSTVIRMTRSIKHAFKLCILLEYVVFHWRYATLQEHTKDEDALKDWGWRYLPQASKSPNLILDVITGYWCFKSYS